MTFTITVKSTYKLFECEYTKYLIFSVCIAMLYVPLKGLYANFYKIYVYIFFTGIMDQESEIYLSEKINNFGQKYQVTIFGNCFQLDPLGPTKPHVASSKTSGVYHIGGH